VAFKYQLVILEKEICFKHIDNSMEIKDAIEKILWLKKYWEKR
jgi:hypothetical protein